MPSPKNGFNDQWGLASSTGERAAAGPDFPPLTSGQGGPPLIDPEGRVWVRQAAAPPPVPGFQVPWQAAPNALGNTFILLTNPGVLEQISGYVSAAAGVVSYVQVYDLAAAPAADVPIFEVPTVGTQAWSWAPQRWELSAGCVFAVSSTSMLFTAGAAVGRYNALGWE